MAAETIGAILGGAGGYVLGKGQAQQTQPGTTKQDSILVFYSLPTKTTKDFSVRLGSKGKVWGVWFQFYWTDCLLSHLITLDGSPIFKNIPGGENFIALHNTAQFFPCNAPFNLGTTLNVHSVNSDPTNLHRVRIVVYVEYA